MGCYSCKGMEVKIIFIAEDKKLLHLYGEEGSHLRVLAELLKHYS